MADRLTALLTHFELRTRVYFSGRSCGASNFEPGSTGHLHVLRRGNLRLLGADGEALELDEPTVLFYPRPVRHRFSSCERLGAELVCAAVEFGVQENNPLLRSLPSPFVVSLAALPHNGRLLDLLFDEAFAGHCGHRAAVDRLMEVLLIHLFRHGMETGVARSGTLAGLADPRLSKALVAVHTEPGADWTLASMGRQAGMSRARFAAHFVDVIGMTPGDYLAAWRVSVAQTLLRKGRAVGVVANAVGYSTPGALARVFARQLNCSPMQWLQREEALRRAAASASDEAHRQIDGVEMLGEGADRDAVHAGFGDRAHGVEAGAA